MSVNRIFIASPEDMVIAMAHTRTTRFKVTSFDYDNVIAKDGDDIILGAEEHDRLFGNNGEDIIYGEQGNDFLAGNDGLY